MNHEIVWINEGFALSDAGHLIGTQYVDLRDPEERTTVQGLVRGIDRKYALEDCETLVISKPAKYRSSGQEMILDVQEGLAKEETIVTSEGTSTDILERRAISDLNEALELSNSRIHYSYKQSNVDSNWHAKNISHGEEWWILCASIKPEDDELEAWRNTLPENYDHVSEIGQPTKFAQALARMVAEQIGPRGQEGYLRDTTEGFEKEKTKHMSQMVIHGPVVYVDSVYDTIDAAPDTRSRIAAFIFAKSKGYAAQKEYRFAVMNEGADEEIVKLRISGMMRDALEPINQKLVRITPVPMDVGEKDEEARLNEANEAMTPVSRQRTVSQKSTLREAWKFESKGRDGDLRVSDEEVRETVKERIVTETIEDSAIQPSTQDDTISSIKENTLSQPDSMDEFVEQDDEHKDENIAREIALDEFETDDPQSDGDSLAIPIRTATGRAYKSFEEMMSDPTYPLNPMAKGWRESANSPEEIIKTYGVADIVDMKMHDIKKEHRQDIASAGWYAMMCVRNIYAKLGDIVDTISIERERFVVIRLKDNAEINATGRIVIAPNGAYAYSIQLPAEEKLGWGGLEWGATLFPLGNEIDMFDSYGWTKKIN